MGRTRQNDVISLKLKDKKWPEIKEKLTKRYNLAIRRLTQTKADDIVQIYINALLEKLTHIQATLRHVLQKALMKA